MSKIKLRLLASYFLLMVAVVMIVTVSYAWMTISKSPGANGISVTLSGGKTILLAPDLTQVTASGKTVHYPGAFENELVISQHESYSYLRELGGLEPVSTADGQTWILPVYDQETGVLKETGEFAVDNTLAYANEEKYGGGRYVYLDFWIVSPGTEYKVRVSADKNGKSGSYLLELPRVVEQADSPFGYALEETEGTVAASARVGFLVNEDMVTSNEEMEAYMESPGYDSRYHAFSGQYQEKGEEPRENAGRFVLYEPNALLHPSGAAEEGAYVVTTPLTWDPESGQVRAAGEQPLGAIQKNSSWRRTEDGELELTTALETALAGQDISIARMAEERLYEEQLQGQVGSYVERGRLIEDEASLYEMAAATGSVDKERVESLYSAGATKDAVLVTLKRDEPQRIRMFLWMEGQDVDCTNQNSAFTSGRLALGIELAGASQ